MTSAALNRSELFDIEITREISSVLADWEQLEKQGLSTPFQTRAWLRPFYEILAPTLKVTPLFILVRDKSGIPLMLLPLCERTKYGMTIIEFADLEVSDYNAPLIASDFNPSPETWTILWRDVLRQLNTGSVLKFHKMPSTLSGHPNPLVTKSPQVKQMDVASWGLSLPSSFKDYELNILDQTLARELAKKNRRVTKRGLPEYASAQTIIEKNTIFEILAKQRQARCDEMGRANILANETYRNFYKAVAVDSSLPLASLDGFKVGDEVVATIFALNHNNAMYVIMSTYQGGEWKSASLGNVVILTAVEHAINNKRSFFDLTIGNEGYKQNFGAQPTPLYALTQSLTFMGGVATLVIDIKTQIKKIIKYLFRLTKQRSR